MKYNINNNLIKTNYKKPNEFYTYNITYPSNLLIEILILIL